MDDLLPWKMAAAVAALEDVVLRSGEWRIAGEAADRADVEMVVRWCCTRVKRQVCGGSLPAPPDEGYMARVVDVLASGR